MSDSENKPIEAHEENITLHLKYYYPEHAPREDDPHASTFRKTRERMERLGLLRCWICGTDKDIELHHSHVEWALQQGVDLSRFHEAYPEFHVESDEEFADWVNSEGNLLPLCSFHHRCGGSSIHLSTYPAWVIQKVWRADLPSPVSADK